MVRIVVKGQPSVLKGVLSGEAELTSTWYNFLESLGLKLTPQDGISVRTLLPVFEDGKPGWCAELSEPIDLFLGKYRRPYPSHTVLLIRKKDLIDGPEPRLRPYRRITYQGPRRSSGGGGGGHGKNLTAAPPRTRAVNRPTPSAPSIVISTSGGGVPATTSNQLQLYRKPRFTPGFSLGSLMAQGHNVQGRYGTRLNSMITAQKNAPRAGTLPIARTCRRGGGGGSGGEVCGRYFATTRSGGDPLAESNGPPQISSVRSAVVKRETEPGVVEKIEIEDLKIEEVEGEEEEAMEEDESSDGTTNGRNMEVEEEECNASMVTALTVEQYHLRRDGIVMEDVKTPAARTLDRLSNGFFLRCRGEIQMLKRKGLWVRNVQRAPLSCYLLQELFK